MQGKIKIHFVCRGNIFRSRLAEAYMKSFDSGQWDISSSGIAAAQYPNQFLSPWAKIEAHQNGITSYVTEVTTQTTSELLQNSDIIVFMNTDVYTDAAAQYDFNHATCLVWNIKDRQDWHYRISLGQMRRLSFRHIKGHVDTLVQDMSHGSWVDIVDENNVSLGFKLPITIANKNQLWHRGCHTIITTPDNHTLVQKRSKNILFSPNLIDITLGGLVDTGETPKQAVRREISEEIGLVIHPDQIKRIEVVQQTSYRRRSKLHNKLFNYTYHVQLNSNSPVFSLQQSEVSKVVLLSPRYLKRLVKLHRLKGVGQLNYSYSFYVRILNLIDLW